MKHRPVLLLVDDDELLRRQLARTIATHAMGVESVGTPADALVQLDVCDIDAALIDLRLGTDCGLELLERVHLAAPDLPLGLMTGFDLREHRNRASRVGALTYIKPLRAGDLPELLRRARRHFEARRSPLDRLDRSHLLSERERQCAERALEHETHQEIAAALEIRQASVRTYLRRALDKLGFDRITHVRERLKHLQGEEG